MKNFSFFFIMCFTCSQVISQMVIDITSTPQLTPLLDDIYIAGDMNNWAEGDENFKLTEQENGHWTIALSGTENENVEFKFTRGAWAKVEGSSGGGYIPNRTVVFQNGTTLQLTIDGWEDIAGTHTVSEHVRILDTDFFMPQLNRSRRIWICLPEDYDTSQTDYPVCYMHDGQNVFDAATSFAGEWNVDESMLAQSVADCASTIIVGIDNGGASRIDEYAPWLNAEYNEGGEGEEYVNFIIETLKPFIDQNFRTLPQRENTCTAGSSLGALIGMYMLIEHNEVFSKAGIFSPAFWFNPEIYDLAADQPFSQITKMLMVCGDSESANMVAEMQLMETTLLANGSSDLYLESEVDQGGEHSEYYWSQQFPMFIQGILSCITAVPELSGDGQVILFPNPAKDRITLQMKQGRLWSVDYINSAGKVVASQPLDSLEAIMDVSRLSRGNYTLRVKYMPYPTSTVVSTIFKLTLN
jgi:predicted alpha/beta superfamily hydrolase